MRNSFISLFRLIAILIKFNLHSDLKIVYIYITILRSSLIENRFFKQKREKNSSTILSTICTKSLSLSSLREKCIDLEKYIGVTIVTLIFSFFPSLYVLERIKSR